jgi:hypothetical protein
MSDIVKLGSKLPGDAEVNGVDATVEDLVDDPRTLRAAFVQYDVGKIVLDPDTGDHVPTIRIRRFEPLGKNDEVSKTVIKEYFAAVEKRTGKKALPLEYAEVVEQGSLGDDDSNVVQGGF